MFASSLWFRLLLSIAMILNGSVAVAGAMPTMPAMNAADTASVAIADAAHCQDDVVLTSMDQQDAVPVTDSTNHADHENSPDCCKSGACHCACVHSAATLDFMTSPIAVIATTIFSAFVDKGVVAQALPRLDRPPIG